jgi:cysteine desulfurase / selenocysteine lyase
MVPQSKAAFHYPFDIEKIRSDFPILCREIHPGIPLVFLDSAATSQKPIRVMEAMSRYYRLNNANIHRAIYTLAVESTNLYEEARARIAECISADDPREIVFTRNATEAVNLVAYTWGRKYLRENDLLLLSEMEHHSNLVPWQIMAGETGAQIRFVPITPQGELDQGALDQLLLLEPKLVAITHMSNVLGTINPIQEIIQKAHRAGARVLIDGAQSVPHMNVNVSELDPDFMVISSHKMCGPTGIGALYAKKQILNDMPPFMGGGEMIHKVDWTSFEANDIPYKFEAGTPAIAEAIGWGEAVQYLKGVGMGSIHQHEQSMAEYAMDRLREIPGIQILGPAPEKRGGIVAFSMENIHPHDIAQILDSSGIAVRAGHHCAMPLHQKVGLSATTRASFYLYNRYEDADALVEGLRKVKKMFS